jgi:hypothetical protein
LQCDGIHRISGFAMAYKGKTSFTMAHNEVSPDIKSRVLAIRGPSRHLASPIGEGGQ